MSGVPILSESTVRAVKAYDPTVDVFFNPRLGCYILVQEVWPPRLVDSDLVGCPAITGTHSKWKALRRLTTKDGHHIEPTPLFVRFILDQYTRRACDMSQADWAELESGPNDHLVGELQGDNPFAHDLHRARTGAFRRGLAQTRKQRDEAYERLRADNEEFQELEKDAVIIKDRKHFTFGNTA